MKRLLLTIISLFLVGTCSFAADSNLASIDVNYSKKIVGSWSETIEPYGVSTFHEGGEYSALIYDSVRKNKLICEAKGKWWIKEGKLYNEVSSIEPPIMPIPAEPSIDIIKEISDSAMLLIDQEGKSYFKYRVKAGSDNH